MTKKNTKLKWKFNKKYNQFYVRNGGDKHSWKEFRIEKTKLLKLNILFKGSVEIGRFSTLKKAQRVAQLIHDGQKTKVLPFSLKVSRLFNKPAKIKQTNK